MILTHELAAPADASIVLTVSSPVLIHKFINSPKHSGSALNTRYSGLLDTKNIHEAVV